MDENRTPLGIHDVGGLADETKRSRATYFADQRDQP